MIAILIVVSIIMFVLSLIGTFMAIVEINGTKEELLRSLFLTIYSGLNAYYLTQYFISLNHI